MMNLEEIKAREQEATPGPWVSIFDLKGFTVYDMSGKKGKVIAKLPNARGKSKRNDADFIAHARTDILVLIAEAERLTAENEQDKKLIESYKESNLEQATENYELEKENATLKKALGIASKEVNTAFETLVSHGVLTMEHKASNAQENVDTWMQRARQAQQTHETQEAEK